MECSLSSVKFISPNKRARCNLRFALFFAGNCSNDTASLMQDPVRCAMSPRISVGFPLLPAGFSSQGVWDRRKIYFQRCWLHRRSRDKRRYICARGRRKDNSPSLARSLSPSNSRKIDRFRRSYKTIP